MSRLTLFQDQTAVSQLAPFCAALKITGLVFSYTNKNNFLKHHGWKYKILACHGDG